MNGYGNGYPYNAYQTLVGIRGDMVTPSDVAQAMPGIMQLQGWPGYGSPCGPVGAYGANCGISFSSPQCDPFYDAAAKTAVASRACQTPLACNSLDQAPNTPIASNTARTLSCRPVVPICITRYVVPSTCGQFFVIQSIQCTKIEWLDGVQAVPALTCSENNTNPCFKFPSVYPGTDVLVRVFNFDGSDQHYFSTFIGFEGPGCYPCLGP